MRGEGYNVPKFLADMRDHIEFTNGMKMEGLFRLSGSETEIAQLFEQYTAGADFSYNAHNAANLMKRWFKSWKGDKLLSRVDAHMLTANPFLDLEALLIEPQLSIWKWLLQLFVDVFAYREYNMMTPTNIG